MAGGSVFVAEITGEIEVANVQVIPSGVKIMLILTDDEASILKAMMQNGEASEGEIAEGVRKAIFEALQNQGY